MQIFVQTFTGNTLSFAVEAAYTIQDVKAMIHDTEGIPSEVQRLFFGGTELENGLTVANYDMMKRSLMPAGTTFSALYGVTIRGDAVTEILDGFSSKVAAISLG